LTWLIGELDDDDLSNRLFEKGELVGATVQVRGIRAGSTRGDDRLGLDDRIGKSDLGQVERRRVGGPQSDHADPDGDCDGGHPSGQPSGSGEPTTIGAEQRLEVGVRL
jgi:hypothetical protein